MVSRSTLGCFFDDFLMFFLIRRENVKCGFDSLFIMYKAHGNIEKNVKNQQKAVEKWTYLLDRFETPILGSFWQLLGSIWGALGRQIEEKKGSENWFKNWRALPPPLAQ